MLLTRLSNSAKAVHWSTPIRNLAEGSALLASETPGEANKSTTLDWLLIEPSSSIRTLCTITLSDEGAQETLAKNGYELDDVLEANATLANMLVASCETNGVHFDIRGEAVRVHLKDKLGGVTVEVKLDTKLVLQGDGLSDEVVRMFEVFRREPRKESRKRGAQAVGTQEPTQGSDAAAATLASNVSQVVKAKKKKGLKI